MLKKYLDRVGIIGGEDMTVEVWFHIITSTNNRSDKFSTVSTVCASQAIIFALEARALPGTSSITVITTTSRRTHDHLTSTDIRFPSQGGGKSRANTLHSSNGMLIFHTTKSTPTRAI